MAARAKRESRPPKRFIDEVEQLEPCAMKKKKKKKKKKPKKDNYLYDIEVMKFTRRKIHEDSICWLLK